MGRLLPAARHIEVSWEHIAGLSGIGRITHALSAPLKTRRQLEAEDSEQRRQLANQQLHQAMHGPGEDLYEILSALIRAGQHQEAARRLGASVRAVQSPSPALLARAQLWRLVLAALAGDWREVEKVAASSLDDCRRAAAAQVERCARETIASSLFGSASPPKRVLVPEGGPRQAAAPQAAAQDGGSASLPAAALWFAAGKLAEPLSVRVAALLYRRSVACARAPAASHERLALCLAAQNRGAEAKLILEDISPAGGLSGLGMEVLANLRVDAHEVVGARRLFEQSLRHGVPMSRLVPGLAVCQAALHEGGGARRALRRALAAPDLPPAALHRCLVAASLLSDLEQVRAVRARMLSSPGLLPEEHWVELAETLCRLDAGDEALAVVHDQVCPRAPKCEPAWRLAAELHQAAGHLLQAAEAWWHLAGLCPKDASVQLAHGRALLLSPQGGLGARAAFDRALALDPDNLEALEGRAWATELEGEPPEMTEWLWRLHCRRPGQLPVCERFIAAAGRSGTRVGEARQAIASVGEAALPEAVAWRAEAYRALDRALTGGGSRAACQHVAGQGELAEAGLAEVSQAAATDPQAAAALLWPTAAPSASPAAGAPAASAAGLGQGAGRHLREVLLPSISLGGDAAVLPDIEVSLAGRRVLGIEIGYTHDGRSAVLVDEQHLVWAPWGERAAQRLPPAVDRLRCGRAFVPRKLLRSVFAALLRRPVVGTLSVDDFARQLSRHGEIFLVGGAVRDTLVRPSPDHLVADVDMATTVTPNLVPLLGAQLARGHPGLADRPAGVVSPYSSQFFGLVSFGEVRGEEVRSRLDVTSLRSYGAFAPPTRVEGARSAVLPLAFGGDLLADSLARDFSVNALYYAPHRELLLDPTGHGVEDLLRRRLRLCKESALEHNEMLPLRYLKMRAQGFSAPPQLKKQVAGQLRRLLDAPDADVWRQRALQRAGALPGAGAAGRLRRDAWSRVLAADGMGALAQQLWPVSSSAGASSAALTGGRARERLRSR